MNYGKYETERRIKSLHSKSGKYASRLFLNIFKALFVLFLFLAVVGASIGFGMVKGIIDNAPSVDILNIQPDRFATTVYDAAGNLTDTLVTSGSNRESATYEELPQNLVNAFIAIEDSRFRSHNGIDIRSIARAVKGVSATTTPAAEAPSPSSSSRTMYFQAAWSRAGAPRLKGSCRNNTLQSSWRKIPA